MHSCGSERRVSAELNIDSSDDVTLTDVKVKQLKVKVSIPADYAMDVYVAPRYSATSVTGTNDYMTITLC